MQNRWCRAKTLTCLHPKEIEPSVRGTPISSFFACATSSLHLRPFRWFWKKARSRASSRELWGRSFRRLQLLECDWGATWNGAKENAPLTTLTHAASLSNVRLLRFGAPGWPGEIGFFYGMVVEEILEEIWWLKATRGGRLWLSNGVGHFCRCKAIVWKLHKFDLYLESIKTLQYVEIGLFFQNNFFKIKQV